VLWLDRNCLWEWESVIGGNQREMDRQRAAKRAEKQGGKQKKPAGAGNQAQQLANKKELDADIMRQKQLKALEKKDDS